VATRKRASGSGTRKAGQKYIDRDGFAYTYRLPDAQHCNGWNPHQKAHCRSAPGYRTDHPGEGRCYVHKGREPRHGQRSERLKGAKTLKQRASRYAVHEALGKGATQALHDPELLRIEDEVGLAQAMVTAWVAEHKSDAPDSAFAKQMFGLLDSLVRLKEVAHRMAEAWTDRRAISFMDYLREVIRNSLERHLPGNAAIPKVLLEIAEEAERFKI